MFFKKGKYILTVDIGGTKTVFAVMDANNEILVKKIYPSIEIKNFTDTLREYMRSAECRKYKITEACIAIAGPVNAARDYARPTNLEWTVDKHNLLVHSLLKRIILLNDFEAAGFAMDELKPEQYIELTSVSVQEHETIAIIGIGTGLGMSILPNIGGKHYPLPSEGGHVNLPINAKDPVDVKFQTYLIQKKLYHDSEDIVSGRGITNIYNFLLTQKVKHDKRIALAIKREKDESKPSMITKYALEDKDILCIRTLEMFIKYYARVARNLALTTLCTRLVLAGGITPKIMPLIQDIFIEEFTQHDIEGIHRILEQIQVVAITDPNITLHGAANALKIGR